MRKTKKILYLDSEIIVKAGVFLKLMLSGENYITMTDLVAFNKKWAGTIQRELDYDSYVVTPKSNLETALLRYCSFDKSIQRYTVDVQGLKIVLSSLETYRSELSANKLYMSIFDNMLSSFADTVKQKTALEIYEKLNKFVETYCREDNIDKYSIKLPGKELVGKIIIMYAELLYENKIGLNFEISLPSEREIEEQSDRLSIQEKSFVRILEEDNLAPSELEVIAKSIREKRFLLTKQAFLVSRIRSRKCPTKTPEESKPSQNQNVDDAGNTAVSSDNQNEAELELERNMSDVMTKFDESVSQTTEKIDDIMKTMPDPFDSFKKHFDQP